MNLVFNFNVFGANQRSPRVHHLSNSVVGPDSMCPKDVVERSHVACVAIVVKVGRRRCQPTVTEHGLLRWDLWAAHIRETACQVGLLPQPPEAIKVGMVKEEHRVSRRIVLVFHLEKKIVSIYMCEAGLEERFVGLLTVPPVPK